MIRTAVHCSKHVSPNLCQICIALTAMLPVIMCHGLSEKSCKFSGKIMSLYFQFPAIPTQEEIELQKWEHYLILYMPCVLAFLKIQL